MKHIQKAGAPHDYVNWCNEARGTVNEDYRCLQNPEKESLHQALIKEQGWLCAYTMRQIDEDGSHIEHIKPESLCRSEQTGSDLRYANLVACFPRDGMAAQYSYGARHKDDWWDNDGEGFVSPIDVNCETRFHFDLDGSIEAVENHPAALTTIRVLRLDHRSLSEDRMRAIHEFVYGPTGTEPLSKAQAIRAAESICNRSGSGRFHEFCVAIRDALAQHKRQLEKITNRRRFGRIE
jgi:uncharacterized protein (TIGR02646 family)